MKLVVFDVDGTLVDHGRLEDDCYVNAFQSVFGWRNIDTDWSRCRHVTDGGITREIYQRRCGHPATADEIDQVKARFLANYQTGVNRQPGELRAMPGVREMLAQLPKRDWRLAVATGAWQSLARFKLATAGVELDGIPFVTGDDSDERETIMTMAIAAAQRHYRTRQFERVAYVGDAVWDVKVSRVLGLPFLGIGKRHQQLLAVGATHALPDFNDLFAYWPALAECGVPVRHSATD